MWPKKRIGMVVNLRDDWLFDLRGPWINKVTVDGQTSCPGMCKTMVNTEINWSSSALLLASYANLQCFWPKLHGSSLHHTLMAWAYWSYHQLLRMIDHRHPVMVSSGQIHACYMEMIWMVHGYLQDAPRKTQLFLAAVLSSAQNTAFRRAPPMQLQPALLGQRHRKLPPWRNSGVGCCWGKGYNQVRTRWRRRWWWWRIWTCCNTMKQKVCRWMMYVLRDSCGNSCFHDLFACSDHEHAKDTVQFT